jgi:hypothetical protein
MPPKVWRTEDRAKDAGLFAPRDCLLPQTAPSFPFIPGRSFRSTIHPENIVHSQQWAMPLSNRVFRDQGIELQPGCLTTKEVKSNTTPRPEEAISRAEFIVVEQTIESASISCLHKLLRQKYPYCEFRGPGWGVLIPADNLGDLMTNSNAALQTSKEDTSAATSNGQYRRINHNCYCGSGSQLRVIERFSIAQREYSLLLPPEPITDHDPAGTIHKALALGADCVLADQAFL